MSLTGFAFLVCYLAGLVLGLFVHPRFGLYTYLAVFYLHPPSRWWGAFLPDLRWSLLAALITLIGMHRLQKPQGVPSWNATVPAGLLIAFTIWMWIQNLWALDHAEHLEASVLFTKYVVLFYLIYRLIDSPAEVARFMVAHVIGCGYLGVLAYLAPDSGRLEGVGGPGIDEANALGMFSATGALCGAMLILGDRTWKRWVSIAAMPLILNTIVQSESRGTFLGLLAGGIVLWYLRPPAYRRLFYVFAVLGTLAFGYVAQDVFWERMRTLRAAVNEPEEIDNSAQGRIVLAQAQLRMFLSYPLGTGHRGTAVLSTRYLDAKWLAMSPDGKPSARSSHNTLLSALVEQGVPGIVIFTGLILWLVRRLRALKRYSLEEAPADSRAVLFGAAAGSALVLVFVSGMFTDYLKAEVQIWMFAILAVLMHVLVPQEKALPAESSGKLVSRQSSVPPAQAPRPN